MTKPFNLADAKLGHPVQTASGAVATILKFDGRGDKYPLIGVAGEMDDPHSWTIDGRHYESAPNIDLDLEMAPLGQVDGRDVYPGDMLLHRGTYAETPVPYGVPFVASDWKWPRTYPVTQMADVEIFYKLPIFESNESRTAHLVAIVNEAIKHGIDNGYLFDAREFDSFTQSDGSPSTPADIVQAMRSLMESNDALRKEHDSAHNIRKINDDYFEMLKKIADMVGHKAGTPLAELPAHVVMFARAVAQAAMSNGWHAAYDKGGLRIDCPRLTDENLDAFISTVK